LTPEFARTINDYEVLRFIKFQNLQGPTLFSMTLQVLEKWLFFLSRSFKDFQGRACRHCEIWNYLLQLSWHQGPSWELCEWFSSVEPWQVVPQAMPFSSLSQLLTSLFVRPSKTHVNYCRTAKFLNFT